MGGGALQPVGSFALRSPAQWPQILYLDAITARRPMPELVLAPQAINVTASLHQADIGPVRQPGGRGIPILADIVDEGGVDKTLLAVLIATGQIDETVIQRDRGVAADRQRQPGQLAPPVAARQIGIGVRQIDHGLGRAVPPATAENELLVRDAHRRRQAYRRAEIIRQGSPGARRDFPSDGLPVESLHVRGIVRSANEDEFIVDPPARGKHGRMGQPTGRILDQLDAGHPHPPLERCRAGRAADYDQAGRIRGTHPLGQGLTERGQSGPTQAGEIQPMHRAEPAL